MPSPTPICTEKSNYGALSLRIKIVTYRERRASERERYIIYYIYTYIHIYIYKYIYIYIWRSKKGSQDK